MYRKVFIKSEADLPKDNGWYFCFESSKGYRVEFYHSQRNIDWFEKIDWYLRPVTREEIVEVLKKHILPQDLDRNRWNLLHGDKAWGEMADELMNV